MTPDQERIYFSLQGDKSVIFVPPARLSKPDGLGVPQPATAHPFYWWASQIVKGEKAPDSLPGYQYLNHEQFRALITDIKTNGWKSGSMPKVVIDRHGQIILTDGLHRSAAAFALGIPTIPCEVLWRELEWTALKHSLLAAGGGVPTVYQGINHPDFDRWGVIRKDSPERAQQIHSLVPAGSKGVDLGCNSGALVVALEALGHQMQGVDANPHLVAAARYRARMAPPVGVGRDVSFRLPGGPLPQVDFAVCVSVLHHYLTSDTGSELVHSLTYAAPIVVFDSPRVGDLVAGDSQQTDPEAMGRWFCNRAGGGSVEVIATDGRRPLLVWRRGVEATRKPKTTKGTAPQVVGLVGPAFSGSTLLSMVLDGLPGVAGVGETHWITDYGWGNRDKPNCMSHGPECPVWTPEFLTHLENHPTNWWPQIAKRTGCQILVSSDKNPLNFDRFGRPDKVIVPYKDPRAWVASWFRHQETTDTEEAISRMFGHYVRDLKWLEQNQIPWISVSIEDLAANPDSVLRALATWLGVEFDPSALDIRAHSHCQIGGNQDAALRESESYRATFGEGIRVDNRWTTELPPGVAESVIIDPRVKDVLSRLQERVMK